MSNLISRKEAIEIIESLCTDGKMYGNDNITLIDAYEAIDRLAELATTYDVDKVVEKLEKLIINNKSANKTECENMECLSNDCIECMTLHAIEIVKGGVR